MLISILLNSSPSQAAIVPNYYVQKPEQVPFFKSATSLFPSGYTTLEKLKKHLTKSEATATSRYYLWNKIYFDEDELRPLFATHLSKFVIDNATNERLKVLETNSKTLQVYSEKMGALRRVKISDVHADAYDLGFAMALKDTYIKTKAMEKASILTTIPLGTAIEVEKYENGFALIRYQSYRGYVSLTEVITKFDLASFIFHKDQWLPVKQRQHDTILTSNNVKISLNNIKGIITPPQLGIIASSSQKIPLWSKVQISKTNLPSWQQSKLPDHGQVFWRPNKEFEQVFYTIDEILKKNVSNVSFHPNNPFKGLVSADGVYITQNGTHWKKLLQFEDYNGPVLYSSDALLFVGNFRSIDGGHSFENYIQIEKLASAIEFQYGFTPKKLQVQKIDSPTPLRIKIEIDTGIRKIQMESPVFSQNWRAVKT